MEFAITFAVALIKCGCTKTKNYETIHYILGVSISWEDHFTRIVKIRYFFIIMIKISYFLICYQKYDVQRLICIIPYLSRLVNALGEAWQYLRIYTYCVQDILCVTYNNNNFYMFARGDVKTT